LGHFDYDGVGTIDHALHQRSGDRHEESTRHNCCDAVVAKQMVHDPSEEERRKDFWDHNKEIEDAHVDTGLAGRKRSREHGIRHGEGAGPGDADTDHGQKENIFVMDDCN